MKRVPTFFLRAAIVVIGLAVIAVSIFILPLFWGRIDNVFTDYAYAVYGVFVAFWLATLPFLVGLYKGWRLLDYIDQNKAFSKISIKALGAIAACAGAMSVIFFLSLPFFYIWAENDDAPGVLVVSLVLIGAPLVVSVFAAVLQRLMGEAVELKSENELTV